MTAEKTEASSISISKCLKLVEIEGKGRGLVASLPLKGGQIILQESPILTFSAFPLKLQQEDDFINNANSNKSTKYCSYCFKCLVLEDGFTFTCSSCWHYCNDIVFCSSRCQSLALTTTHTPLVCQALRQLRHCSFIQSSNNFSSRIRRIVITSWRWKRKGNDRNNNVSPPNNHVNIVFRRIIINLNVKSYSRNDSSSLRQRKLQLF
ncbi:Histone-lysine N-methyltransferase ASHR2 [Bienertia sinuspersici]